MKKSVLIFLLCLLAASSGYSQLATLIDSTVVHGRLFTDGNGLYELRNDSIYTVNTTTGALTLLHKLPAPPIPGSTSPSWKNPVKTANGFLIFQSYEYNGTRFALWGYNGTRWDTLMNEYSSYGNNIDQVPIRVGNNYVYDFTSVTTIYDHLHNLVITDGSRAGTRVVFRVNDNKLSYGTYRMYYGPEYADDTRQLFFELDFTDTTSVTRIRTRLFRLNSSGVSLVDSCNYSTNYLGVLGNEVYYYYQNDTLIPGTTTRAYIPLIKKRNLTTGVISTFKTLPQQTSYARGNVLNNRLLVVKYAPAPYDSLLVSVDPATGLETPLTDSFSTVPFALQSSGHLYFHTSSRNTAIKICDGLSDYGSRINYQRTIPTFTLINKYPLDVTFSTACGDALFFSETFLRDGTLFVRRSNQKLFRLQPNGTVDSQMLVGRFGYVPFNFVTVGGTVYYRSGIALWKITACTVTTAVQPAGKKEEEGFVFPNPAHTSFTIALGNQLPEAHLELYDATGRQVLSQAVHNGQSISVSELPTGLYIYRLLQSGGTLLRTGRLSVIH